MGREQDREQNVDVIGGVIIDGRVISDWKVVDGPTDIVPRNQRSPTRGFQHPLAKKDYIDGEYTVHKDEPEDPMRRVLILGGLTTLFAAAVSTATGIFSGSKPETSPSLQKPEVPALSLDAESLDAGLAAIRETLNGLNKQGLTIPTPQATDLLARIAQLAENPAEVAPEVARLLSPPSVSSVENQTGPAVSAAQRLEVKPNPEFLNRVRVVAAELPPAVVPVRTTAPVLYTAPWDRAPDEVKQRFPDQQAVEAVTAPSLDELQYAVTGLIAGLAESDPGAIAKYADWLRQNAPLSVRPLVTLLTGSADQLITLQDANVLYPTPFVFELIAAIHLLDPTTPEGQRLLDKALKFFELHLDKLALNATELIDAYKVVQASPQTIELPHAVISPPGIHIVPPPDVISGLTGDVTAPQDGDGVFLGPVSGFQFSFCLPEGWNRVVRGAQTVAGLQVLGPGKYVVQRVGGLDKLVPSSLFGFNLAWLKALAGKFPIQYAELIATQGLWSSEGLGDGLGPPIFMLDVNFGGSGLREGDRIGFRGIGWDNVFKALKAIR